MNYYRITAYYPEQDFCFIMDSNGMFEKLWQFSAELVSKGMNIIEVSRLENILDINIKPAEQDNTKMFVRATADGKPQYTTYTLNNITYKAIQVGEKMYVPNKGDIIQYII